MWTCTSNTADDCVGRDLGDPSIYTIEGEAVCYYCALELGIITPHGQADESDEATVSGREDAPYGVTD